MKKNVFAVFIQILLLFLLISCDDQVDLGSDHSLTSLKNSEISTITLGQFADQSNSAKILSEISNYFESNNIVEQKNSSKKIKILTNEIKVLKKDKVTTYTFRIKKPTLKSSVFENFLIHKFEDNSYQFGISKFKFNNNSTAFPYNIKYKKIKENKLKNIDFLESFLKNEEQECYRRVDHVCSQGDAEIHETEPVIIDGTYYGYCGGTDWSFEPIDCADLNSGGSGLSDNSGTGSGGFGDSNSNNNNSFESNGGGSYPDNYSPSGAILPPPCGDSVHGCDIEQRRVKLLIDELHNPVTDKPIEFYLIALYKNSFLLDISVFSKSHINDLIRVGEYSLTKHFDSFGNLVFYTAFRTSELGIEYIIKEGALEDFKDQINLYTYAANWFYNGGVPSNAQLALAADDYWKGLSEMWNDAIHSPEWWAYTITSIGHLTITNKVPRFDTSKYRFSAKFLNNIRLGRIVGKLREARNKIGNFGMGTATRAESEIMGKAWVGKGFRESQSSPGTFISNDKLKQYRRPSFKPNLNKTQSNFEWRHEPNGQWINNGHLEIIN